MGLDPGEKLSSCYPGNRHARACDECSEPEGLPDSDDLLDPPITPEVLKGIPSMLDDHSVIWSKNL